MALIDDPGTEAVARPASESPSRPARGVLARRAFRTREADEVASRLPGARRAGAIEAQPALATRRVASVDALRGFTMIWIIGGDGLAKAIGETAGDSDSLPAAAARAVGGQFEHVDWAGYTFYDMLFPMFIFITGVSIVFSLPKLVEREGTLAAYLRVVRRAVVLFALGIVVYGGLSEYWPDVRILGVLQRIALCYLFASVLFLNLDLRGLVAAFLVVLVGYWALMTFVPVPGIGAGVFDKETNLAWWLDSRYLPGRLWDQTRDPEGLLSTVPAIATCLLGVFAGLLLKNERIAPQQKSLWLAGAGIAMIGLGHLWALQFPIIKYIWTSSFVLVVGGYAVLFLGVFHQIIDVWGYRTWATAFIWIGASAIVLYLVNMIAGFQPLATRLVGTNVSDWLDAMLAPGAGLVLSHALGLTFAVVLAGFLYRRRIFLRV